MYKHSSLPASSLTIMGNKFMLGQLTTDPQLRIQKCQRNQVYNSVVAV